METSPFYVMKPTTFQKQKVRIGHRLDLTESQARPLIHGGFLTNDVNASRYIAELTHELKNLTYELGVAQEELKQSEAELENLTQSIKTNSDTSTKEDK
ncbi:hypothetical protein [Teredinibacter sp. KSP-S5-2]|uniref:hypothetical protein n=1 Tax=Teredinibacter sp. KSP-S5-2 TaxID=3034506 RepID=UPI0029342CC1|nr:hypothetical protein [Teredinibacter sp. KSP-S5-2]WNO10444.1 hypothetical protein P5V12_04595 [Teredinibacter sp. KSP-S5-2]